jgi:hypothetical protein
MSLLRLLSAGKSLVGLKEATARYQMSDPRVMPRFVSPRNPFKTGKASVEAPREPARKNPSVRIKPPAPSEPKAQKATPVPAASTEPNRAPAKRASESILKRLVTGCKGKLKEVLRAREKKPKAAAQPRTRPGPIQGELSLDAIKVVRNDLSDADFEVVPTKVPAGSAVPAAAVMVAVSSDSSECEASPALSEATRGRMATRLFCAGKT